MQVTTIEKIIAETETLLPEEQLLLAALLIERARMSYSENQKSSRRRWSEIAGIAPNLMQGQDAQERVSNSRRESDTHREEVLRK